MGIDESDTFSIRWIARYENSLNFHCELVVEAYNKIYRSEGGPLEVGLGELKSKIKMEFSNGETYYDMTYWQQIVLSGIAPMQEFLIRILKGMRMGDEEALDTTIEITEALEDCDFFATNDPRLN